MCHCKYFDYFDFDCGDCGGCTFVSVFRGQTCGDLELLLCVSCGLCKLVPVHRFPVHPVHVFFSLNVEKEQDQNTSRAMDFTWGTMLLIFQFVPNSRCRPGCHQGLQVGDEDMQAAGRFHQQNVMVSQLQTQRSDGERFSYRQRVDRQVIQLYSYTV